MQPGAAEEATSNSGLGQDLNRAWLGRQVAGLIALDRCSSDPDLRAELILDGGRGLALVGRDAVDRTFQQATEGFISITRVLFSKLYNATREQSA